VMLQYYCLLKAAMFCVFTSVISSQRKNRVCFHKTSCKTLTRESLLKGKSQYSRPPSTNENISAQFDIENRIILSYKTSSLNEEVNCTEPSLSVSVRCSHNHFKGGGALSSKG
jgi:hypothetical protein